MALMQPPGAPLRKLRVVPSAFVSYAHEDQEFVLSLVEYLQGQGLDITYDQIVLEIGDSLIRRISAAIIEGDFLIAVVSPASVNSEWCQKELAIAGTQGINEQRVKVLPVRFQGAEMPPMLQDAVWADADRDDIQTVARRLARAITAHLEGREGDAARDAERAEDTRGIPAHAEKPGDADVALIDVVSERALTVLDSWAGVWNRDGNMADIESPQRRLRFDLAKLPGYIRLGLPLVERLANGDWHKDEFFTTRDSFKNAERDIEDELQSVRTRAAQGLPVTPRWSIDVDLGKVPVRRDAEAYLWGIARGDETARITVMISRTALASANDALPSDVVSAKETNGRSVVTSFLSLDQPPAEVMVSTAGIGWPVTD